MPLPRDPPGDWHGDSYPFDMYLAHVGDDIRVIFQTDDGRLLVGSLPPVRAAQAWRRDPAGAVVAACLAKALARGRPGVLLEPAGQVRGNLVFRKALAGRKRLLELADVAG